MAFQQMPSAATDEVVLETQGLHKAFDGTVVAEHLDFVCHRGEIVGIIGPNGTGKSTFGRILAGLLKENSGEVFLFGHKTRPRERMGKVWYIPQDLDSQLFGEDLRSVYKELHADHETGLLTTKQAEYQAPGKCEIFSLFCCPGFPKGHPLAHDFACKV